MIRIIKDELVALVGQYQANEAIYQENEKLNQEHIAALELNIKTSIELISALQRNVEALERLLKVHGHETAGDITMTRH
jgi:type I site-specific restriction-modification system R (restriction) subunit